MSKPKKRKVQGPKVRYGVVGAGWISQAAFMPSVEQTGNSVLTALVTGDEKKASALKEMYGLARTVGYDGLESLFDEDIVDAIYLATPNEKHVDVAVRTLEAGVPLLLEKPMAVSEDECARIADAAKRGGAPVMIAYRLHFEPATLSSLQIARSGKLGDLRFFSSAFGQHVAASNHRAQEGYWAGPVPDMGTYPINAARNLFQSEPIEVMAIGAKDPELGFGFHDTVSVTLRFPAERLAQFTVSYATGSVGHYRVVGKDGDLDALHGFGFTEPIEQVVTVGKDITRHTFERTDQFSGQLHAFSEHVKNGTEPEPNAYEGWADVRVLVAVEESLRTGKPVVLGAFEHEVRYAQPGQAQTFPPTTPPELIDAAAPGEG